MKATGMIRKIDELGRIVLPKELRRNMNLNQGDGMELFVEGNTIMLKKYIPECSYCGSHENLIEHRSIKLCYSCKSKLEI